MSGAFKRTCLGCGEGARKVDGVYLCGCNREYSYIPTEAELEAAKDEILHRKHGPMKTCDDDDPAGEQRLRDERCGDRIFESERLGAIAERAPSTFRRGGVAVWNQ